MNQQQVTEELENLVKEGKERILSTKWYPDGVIGAYYLVDGAIYAGWHTKALTLLKMFLNEETDFVQKFIKCKDNSFSKAQAAINVLESLMEYIKKGIVTVEGTDCVDLNKELHRLFIRFHRIARQIRVRHEDRQTISIEDEYDVQDLLHALLRIYFDDIRPEEWTPSYAGKSARMDFLLKNEKTVIEVKKTRQGLADKQLGDELIVDVDRYRAHPDCQRLICFVYDPEGRIGNPEGLMSDLNTQHQGFLEVIIEPRN